MRVVVGDGRLTLVDEADGAFDVLIIDAFSGDATPAHLLTLEAIDLYIRKLAPDGILLFNTSNRYVDVAAVVAAGLNARGLPVAIPLDPEPGTPKDPEKLTSEWVVSAPNEEELGRLLADVAVLPEDPAVTRPWTDDFSDLLSVIRWGR